MRSSKTLSNSSPRLAPRAGFALIAFAAVALVPGGASAAGPAHHGKSKKHHPAGAVKLPKSKVQHVKGVTCGELHKRWVAGSVVGGYFISDSQQAHDYGVLAKHAKGKTKAADTKLSKKFAKRAKARRKACAGVGGGGGKGGKGGRTTGKPLRFNLRGAIGVALKSGNGASASSAFTSRAGAGSVATASAESTEGSNLQTVSASGQVTDAVSSGKATIKQFLIAPSGKLYVVFSLPVDLETSESAQPGKGCILAQVDPSSGVPTCIDNSLGTVGSVGVGNTMGSPPIQFDSSGAIYYTGQTVGGLVLRKWSNGTTTDLIPPANILIYNWTVLPNGTVILTGYTSNSGASWLRRISPTGSLKSLQNSLASFTLPFPDGNVYVGEYGSHNGVGIYDSSTDSLRSKWWIGTPGTPGGPTEVEHETAAVCASVSNPSPEYQAFCGYDGANLQWAYAPGDGREFVIAGWASSSKVPMEYFPSVSFLPSMVKNVSVAQGIGGNLLLAGTDEVGDQVLTLYNTGNNTEQQLLGPPATTDQYEIYHLNYVAKENKILFDGLRFSDNHYVIGEYDLNTHQVSVVASSTSKWDDLQGF